MKRSVSPWVIVLILAGIYFALRIQPDNALSSWLAYLRCSDAAVCYNQTMSEYAAQATVAALFSLISFGGAALLVFRALQSNNQKTKDKK